MLALDHIAEIALIEGIARTPISPKRLPPMRNLVQDIASLIALTLFIGTCYAYISAI
jgi:hypothetical protein